jgi:hypothetical protein
MVVGLDLFIQHFESYSDHYVLIGGSAYDWNLEQKGLPFRTTKDIDLILIVDARSDELAALLSKHCQQYAFLRRPSGQGKLLPIIIHTYPLLGISR